MSPVCPVRDLCRPIAMVLENLRNGNLRLRRGKLPNTAFLRLCLLLLALAAWGAFAAPAQQASQVAGGSGLPAAPVPASVPAQPDTAKVPADNPAAISGTVQDTNGAEVQDAHVILKGTGGAVVRSAQSGGDGEFTFTGLPPGDYSLQVSGSGWGTYTSPLIKLAAGDFHIVPNILLPVTSSAVVRVTATPAELSEEQVHIAEQQRVFGIFPNFYSSYDWNAPPMQAKQKFQLSLRSLIDPTEFASVAATAGVEQMTGMFSGYGSGPEGYGKRLGAAYATDFTAEMLAFAAFPSLFHQDPRYFYKGTGSFGSRAFYAIASAVVARGDNGRLEPNYSYILGGFAAGAISNLYYPPGNRGASLVLLNGFVDIGEHAGADLIREFVLPHFTSRAHSKSSQQP